MENYRYCSICGKVVKEPFYYLCLSTQQVQCSPMHYLIAVERMNEANRLRHLHYEGGQT